LLLGCCSVACFDSVGIIKQCCLTSLTISLTFSAIYRPKEVFFCHKLSWVMLKMASESLEVEMDSVIEMGCIISHVGGLKMLDIGWLLGLSEK
jgi:hypothetical protein